MDLSDKVSSEQLSNFFVYCCVVLGIESPTFLDNWFRSWVDVESVSYDGRINP